MKLQLALLLINLYQFTTNGYPTVILGIASNKDELQPFSNQLYHSLILNSSNSLNSTNSTI